MKKYLKKINATTLSIACAMSFNALANPIEDALKVDGAQVVLPVEAAKEASTPDFVADARSKFSNFHWQMGGDHSLYYNMHLTEFLPHSVSSPNEYYKPLVKNLDPRIGNLTVETSKGEISVDDYMQDPQFRAQGFMLLHKGEIVYESYNGMKPTDRHTWFSAAKTTVGTILAMLVEEGKVDPNKPVTHYVTELKGTVWDGVSVLDAANHQNGLDNEETVDSLMNPESAVVRFFGSLIGSERPSTGEVEYWIDVAREDKTIEGEKAGEVNRYASVNTHILTKLIEKVENKQWADVFEERVWGKMTARQPALFAQSPDGLAAPLGLMSTTLEDFARFANLFTPSWSASTNANDPIVTQNVIDRIRTSGDKSTFKGSNKESASTAAFNEPADYQSYQFDYIFDDGAMAKSGNLGQFIYVDPNRDVVGVIFSQNPYHSGYGEMKGPAIMRTAAKYLDKN